MADYLSELKEVIKLSQQYALVNFNFVKLNIFCSNQENLT